jgi:hypothetical protein
MERASIRLLLIPCCVAQDKDGYMMVYGREGRMGWERGCRRCQRESIYSDDSKRSSLPLVYVTFHLSKLF